MTVLRQQILDLVARQGPIPFEEFMEIGLYDDRQGFFGSGSLRSEKAGDFLTSPEVSPLFGETLANYVNAAADRLGTPFEIVEVAAGSGSLLRPLLTRARYPATAVEVSPQALEALGSLGPSVTVRSELPIEIRGVVIANELVDNLPMAMAQRIEGKWRERWVGGGETGLVMVDADPRQEVLEWLHLHAGPVGDGGWVEVQLAAAEWLRDVLARLTEGSILLIDYGDTSENLLPRRQDGTLRTYRAHHLGPHPLDEPGETDITADVNFSALIQVALEEGADANLHRQDDFLAVWGLRDRLSRLRGAELEAARSGDAMEQMRLRTLKTEAETLLHPRGLGDFRVLELRK